MDLRVLRYFLAVAREESISRAAQAVHITQPSLSRQIMDLERELKTKLFERGRKKRRLMLTPAGALLRKRAEELVLLADKTKTEFLSQDNQISGDVYLGGGETDGMRLAARAVRQMQREHPLVRYHLFSGNAEDVTERLDKGLLDFAVLIGAAKLERYDYITLPVQDRWGLLLTKSHPLAAQKNIRPTDLAGVPLLVSRQAARYNELSGWFGPMRGKLDSVASYNLIYNAALMVEESVGCALTLEKLINTSGNSPLCFRPLQPAVYSPLYLVWKKEQVFSKAAETFLQHMRRICGV